MPSYEELGLPRRNRTILLVEDNKYNRAILKALLQKTYKVLEASNGQEGVGQHHTPA